ncbi:MAG TPA: response regulator [Planctomycetota bacterium]|nr:response regulator [Planctomycetota bacterium]
MLVVEDFDDTRTMIRTLLEMKGCHVLEAVNGKEAVEAASSHCSEIDLILMDLRMPVMTGVEATRRIRQQPATCAVPIVAMSAHCEGNWREEALAAGAIDCFSKPIEFGLLEEILGRYAARGAAPQSPPERRI